MALIGVAGCQFLYFMAVARIPVGTAILVEYTAPVLLVLFAWATDADGCPAPVVLVGSAVAIAGLVLVIGPGALQSVDLLGVLFAFLAAIGAACYYLIAARPSEGLPGVALAWSGLVLLGSLALFAVGGLRAWCPSTMVFTDVPFLRFHGALVGAARHRRRSSRPRSATPRASSATGMLGSRLMSFIALLEVVFATMFAWLLLGETLDPVAQLARAERSSSSAILFVYSERRSTMPVEPLEMPAATVPAATEPAATVPRPRSPPPRCPRPRSPPHPARQSRCRPARRIDGWLKLI